MATGLVIVPALNEATSLPKVVAELRAELPHWDILVVDDGSIDETINYQPAGARILRLPFNLGIGGAVQAGFRYALANGYRLALQVDGDGQHPAAEAHHLIAHLLQADADMVIGSRFLRPGLYHQSTFRRIGTAIIRLQLRVVTGRAFADCASGFRVVNQRLIQAFAHWYPDDYPEPEVLVYLHRSGCRVEEVPVRMRQRESGRSSIPLFSGIVYVAKVSLSLLLGLGRTPWPGIVLPPRAECQDSPDPRRMPA